MATDDNTYGFSKADATELLQGIGGNDGEFIEGRVRGGGGTGRIRLFTLTGTIASGTGLATIRNLADDTEIGTGLNVLDPLGHFDGLTSGYRGFCVKDGSDYVALGPYATTVNWNDPDLRYSRDGGTTWLAIDTAEDCSDVDGGSA